MRRAAVKRRNTLSPAFEAKAIAPYGDKWRGE
jgi:hypothetical protein